MRNPEDEVKDIAKLVTENYHDNYVKETYCDLALSLVLEQPFKIPFVAASVLCANNDKSEAAREVLVRTAILLQRHINAGEWRHVKLLLRFLACLQPLFSDDGVFGLLDELFDRAVDLQTASSDDAVGLELVKIILFTIPYVLAAPNTGLEQRAAELLEKTDIVASTRHALETLVDPYMTPAGEQRPMACPSVISALQSQLQAEAASGWKLACIPRLDRVTASSEPEKAQKHSFPQLSVPSPVNPGPNALFPDVCFSLFADQDVESVPPTSNIAASLLRDAITDTINILDFNRNVAAKFLIDVDCYWAPNTFVKRATAFDKLKDIAPGQSTWKPEDLVVDAVFSQILQLPTAEHKLVYYHSVITEACKIAPAAVAPSLGRAIRFLFRSLDSMDLELSYRYMDWFAHHLSNFEFRWKWTEWIDDLERNNLEPRKAFIVGSLDKEIRLSFAKRIRETLPDAYAPLISEGKMKDTPDFKYLNEHTPYSAQGNAMHALIRKKATEEDIELVVAEIQALASEHGVEDVLVPSTDAYMTSICSVGSKSLSHVLSCIERCKERLLAIGPQSEPARRQIISSVIEYWADHPGTAVNIIDKLLNYTIITPMSVIEWALHDRMDHGRALAQTHIYEMISATMFKVSNRMRQIVRARAEANLSDEQKSLLDETLVRERQTMRDLFNAIIDAVSAVANASEDGMIEQGFDGDSVEQALLQQWGARWARVWRRKIAVEEAVVGEAAIEVADVAREAAERVKMEAEAAKVAADEASAAAAAAVAAENTNNTDTLMENEEDHDVA
jgi:nuclear cap-binding protein subunit 1